MLLAQEGCIWNAEATEIRIIHCSTELYGSGYTGEGAAGGRRGVLLSVVATLLSIFPSLRAAGSHCPRLQPPLMAVRADHSLFKQVTHCPIEVWNT